jgi:hypothetical protein
MHEVPGLRSITPCCSAPGTTWRTNRAIHGLLELAPNADGSRKPIDRLLARDYFARVKDRTMTPTTILVVLERTATMA